ncbi:MAG: serine/threonine-protein kinase [Rudaea sp.]|uniref:protein kinase domain-containing protein n=1 Tax=Rudaea sp. TaxID=2136325 RepID=UPI0039E40926
MPGTVELYELLRRALDAPPARRAALLDAACAGDTALRKRLERLLEMAERRDGFLDRSPLADASAPPSAQHVHAAGRVVGAYRLLRPIGSGGMSEVWLAERVEGGFRQQVAIKLIQGARGAAGERFRAEREILAALAHPGIARLFDGGVEPGGAAWMAMEYVEGEHLAVYCRARGLPLAERLALFMQVCDAVAYAHTRLVVHRDIKPANILVTREAQAKLLDFGIARLLDDETREATRTLQMTPAYAAPEQLSGGRIGTATDVYALGVTLFELLTDRLPWIDDSAPLAGAVHRLLDAPLPSPSRVAGAGADAPVGRRALRGDLDAIVGKALRREPDARYADARALADDLRRHLAHEPVRARADAKSYVLRRFLRRHWLALSTAAAVFVAMAAAIVAVTQQVHKARLEAQRAAAVQSFMVDLFRTNSRNQANPLKARQTTARELLDIGAKRIDAAMSDAPDVKLGVLPLLGDLYKELELTDKEIPLRRQYVELTRTVNGRNSSQTAAALTDLGDVLYRAGDSKQSEAALQDAQAILDANQEHASPTRARLLLRQAQFYRLSDPSRALDYAQQAQHLFARLRPSAEFAELLQLQAKMQAGNGNWQGAVALMNRVIEVLRTLPDADAGLAEAYGTLANFQLQALDYADAERNARLALQSSLTVNGEKHIQTVRKTTSLGTVLFQVGRAREGLDLLAQAKQQFLALPGEQDPTDVAYVLGTHGDYFRMAGDIETGLADMEVVARTLRQNPQSTMLASIISETSAIWTDMGRYDAADAGLKEAAAMREAAGQKPGTAMFNPITQNRFDLALAQRRFADARQQLDRYVVAETNTQGLHRFALIRQLMTIELQARSGDFAAVAGTAASVRAILEASGHADLFERVSARVAFFEGMAELGNGNPGGARPLLRSALAGRERNLLPMSADIAEAQIALAECELALGHFAQAHELADKAQAIHAQHKELGEHYREPLRRLLAHLAAGKPGIAKAARQPSSE